MENPDVTFMTINDESRAYFNSERAKELATTEPELAPYIQRKEGFVYIDLQNNFQNKQNVRIYCLENRLSSKNE